MAESEEQLISMARDAVSQCNWVVGECAAKWTQRYARNRTDGDFGQMVGLSGDQIFQRRRVWEAFGNTSQKFQGLKWSFFYVALNWDDAEDCLSWAQEADATVAEMRAWRRAQRGEDLFAESSEGYSEWAAPLGGIDTSTIPLSRVVDPSQFTPSGMGDRVGLATAAADRTGTATMDMVARDSGESYAPFRADAAAPAPKIREEAGNSDRPELTPDQFWKRASSMLDKLNKALTPRLLKALDDQPESIKERMRDALADIREKVEGSLD